MLTYESVSSYPSFKKNCFLEENNGKTLRKIDILYYQNITLYLCIDTKEATMLFLGIISPNLNHK